VVQELEKDAPTRHSHGVGAVLVITSGERSGDRVELSDAVVIGRAGTDLVLDDPEVSRRHAEIRDRGGHFEIEDLGSRNGTRVNGEPVDRITSLANGAHIRIGRTDLVLEISAEATATVVSDTPPAETAATAASGSGHAAGGLPLFPAQASASPRRIGSRQSIFMVVTFSLMLLVPAALVIYFWQVG
jgi:pSer/pThr/pTyr-binding forkhead associated (FHA) protein